MRKKHNFQDSHPSTPNKKSLFLMTAVLLLLPIFTLYNAHSAVSLYFVAFVVGLLWCSYQLTQDLLELLKYMAWTFALSLLIFIPDCSNSSTYSFQGQMELLPFIFLLFYLIIIIVQFKDEVMPHIGEGLSSVLAISFLYWSYSTGTWSWETFWRHPFQLLVTLYTVFAIVHSMTQLKLNPFSRFILSVGTSMIVIALAIHNIMGMYEQGFNTYQPTYLSELGVILQYFLLGSSAIYLTMNLFLILQFLPNRSTRHYIQDIKALYQEHVDRFSQQHMPVLTSLFILSFTLMAYSLNHCWQWLPSTTAIWLVIFIVTFVMQWINPNPQLND